MRAIKIDVEKQEVYEVETDGSLKSLYELIKCDCIEKVNIIQRKEVIWVDESGLLKKDPIGAFVFDGYPQVLSGNGLILGLRGPENAPTQLSLGYVQGRVTFKDPSYLPEASFNIHPFN